ncbi:MAG: hypothetical protein HQM10_13180 [Candidatus Riflebacteria bacterium]|nr:hypothetical protein [Candidatus Riflebacteria bacterium]
MRNGILKPALFQLLMLIFSGISLAQPQYGFVDYRLLLMAHPLMMRFDGEINRFNESPSQFVINKEDSKISIEKKLADISKKMTELDNEIKPFLQESKKPGKKYAKYWKKRKALQEEYDLSKIALKELSVEGNYHEGKTSNSSVLPVVELINSSLKEILEELRTEKGLSAIIDISPFIKANNTKRSEDFSFDGIPANENLHFSIWNADKTNSGAKITSVQLHEWASEKDSAICRYIPGYTFMPLRGGAKDLVIESFEAVKSRYNPSFKGEDNE